MGPRRPGYFSRRQSRRRCRSISLELRRRASFSPPVIPQKTLPQSWQSRSAIRLCADSCFLLGSSLAAMIAREWRDELRHFQITLADSPADAGCMLTCCELTKRLGMYSRRVVPRPAIGRTWNSNSIQFQLPDELQSKLNISGLRNEGLETSGVSLRSIG